MIIKTSDISFKKYGDVYYEPMNLNRKDILCRKMQIKNKTINCLLSFECEVYIELVSGLSTILIGKSCNVDEMETFAVHHNIVISPNTYFNIIPLSENAVFYLIMPKKYKMDTKNIDPYTYKKIIPSTQVSEILGYYYVVKSPNYKFSGESHNFYELTYVDHGNLNTVVEGKTYTLNDYDCMIYGPKQFHTQQIVKDTSCSYLTVIFNMNTDESELILNKVIKCNNEIHRALKKFIDVSSSDNRYSKTLMLCYLQEIIILLLQLNTFPEDASKTKLSNHTMDHFQEELLEQILEYMHDTVNQSIAIDEVCHKFSISRSTLQTLFKTHLQDSPKNYLIDIKLKKSKELIRENRYTISEISVLLGFSSIHYFSRIFKQRFGISPSAYAKKIYRN